MRKLFSIFSLILLYFTIAFGQAAVDIPIMITDNAGHGFPLYFGLDLTATDGIDVAIGEAELPGWTFGFDARLLLPPLYTIALNSYNDYRNAPSFPFTGQKEHRLAYQVGDGGGTVINIEWNLPSGVTGLLQDIITGTLINVPMSGTGIYTVTNPGAFTQLKMFIDYIDIVPVELTSFTAAVSGREVLLQWVTATEMNNQGFEIERSSSTQDWTKIGYVPGFGTTTEPKSYSFLDQNVTTGTYTYRLKQVDFDGTISYSDAVEVLVDLTPTNFELFQNYPNPFNPTTTIQFQVPKVSDVSIIVYDMLGQEVRSLFAGQVQAGNYSVEWNGLNNAGLKMSSGSYIYRMTADEFVEVKEMILLK